MVQCCCKCRSRVTKLCDRATDCAILRSLLQPLWLPLWLPRPWNIWWYLTYLDGVFSWHVSWYTLWGVPWEINYRTPLSHARLFPSLLKSICFFLSLSLSHSLTLSNTLSLSNTLCTCITLSHSLVSGEYTIKIYICQISPDISRPRQSQRLEQRAQNCAISSTITKLGYSWSIFATASCTILPFFFLKIAIACWDNDIDSRAADWEAESRDKYPCSDFCLLQAHTRTYTNTTRASERNSAAFPRRNPDSVRVFSPERGKRLESLYQHALLLSRLGERGWLTAMFLDIVRSANEKIGAHGSNRVERLTVARKPCG